MERALLPLNLQFFAEDLSAGAADQTAEGATTGAAEAAGADSGSGQEAVDQTAGNPDPAGDGGKGSGDGQDGNIAGDVQKLVQEEIKKAAMSPEERAKYEADEREKSLAAREEAISLRERTADAKALLAENGLPASFTEMVVGKDTVETKKNVEAFRSQFDSAVQAQVGKRLSGKTPEAGSGVSGAGSGDSMMEEIMNYL